MKMLRYLKLHKGEDFTVLN